MHIRSVKKGVDPSGKLLQFAAQFGMGDGRIDLGCANVLMSQQFTDCFDRHPLRQRNGRSECMPRHMERNFFRDTRPRRNLVQAGVAPPVARELSLIHI